MAIAFAKEAGHLRLVEVAEAAKETIAHWPAGLIALHAMAKCCLMCSGFRRYFRSRSSLRYQPREDLPPVGRPWMLV